MEKTFVTRARKYDKQVVPVFIDGQLSNFFYRLSNIREFMGIKANIEMLYLANELFKQKGVTLPIYFGKPISPETFDKSKTDKQWAEEIKNITYNLPKKWIKYVFSSYEFRLYYTSGSASNN